jgi:hypothetical protein
MFTDPNREDPKEPARVAYRVATSGDLAFLLFHEGFRCGLNVRRDYPLVDPPDMEVYIREMFKLICTEIRDQSPRSK